MSMRTLKVVVAGVTLGAIALAFIRLQQRNDALAQEAVALREQANLARLLNQKLLEMGHRVQESNMRLETAKAEVAELRGQTVRMRQLEEEIAKLKADRDRLVSEHAKSAKQTSGQSQKEAELNYNDRVHGPGTSDRAFRARDWGYAQMLYMLKHDGRYPSNLSEAAEFLPKEMSQEARTQAMAELNRFEVVFDGARTDLAGRP